MCMMELATKTMTAESTIGSHRAESATMKPPNLLAQIFLARVMRVADGVKEIWLCRISGTCERIRKSLTQRDAERFRRGRRAQFINEKLLSARGACAEDGLLCCGESDIMRA